VALRSEDPKLINRVSMNLKPVASICVENWGDGGAGARLEGPQPEVRRAEAGSGVLGQGAASPLSTS